MSGNLNIFQTNNYREGRFLIGWAAAHKILHSYEVALAAIEKMKIKPEKRMLGPDLYNVEVPWDLVRWVADLNSLKSLNDHMDAVAASGSIGALRRDLEAKLRATATNKNSLRDAMRRTQELNTANIEKSVGRWGTAVEAAKFVRNASAGTLLAGATVLSGGAAAAALAGGSSLKGVGKYQDTGKAGPALMAFGTSLLVGAFKVQGFGDDKVLVLISSAGEGAGALLEGKSLTEAGAAAALQLTDLGVGKILDSGPVKEFAGKIAITGSMQVINGVADAGADYGRNQAADAVFSKAKKPTNGGVALPHICLADFAMLDSVFVRRAF